MYYPCWDVGTVIVVEAFDKHASGNVRRCVTGALPRRKKTGEAARDVATGRTRKQEQQMISGPKSLRLMNSFSIVVVTTRNR
jgi:hypothetical protein